MALCASAVLSGCAASAANQSTTSSTPFEEAKDSGTPISSDEASSVQAYENDEVLSSEEQAKAEQERRAEIAEKYSIYEPYGMTYDTERIVSSITGKSCVTSRIRSILMKRMAFPMMTA